MWIDAIKETAMSNWATHALIGGVAGLALVQLAPAVVTPELVKVVGG